MLKTVNFTAPNYTTNTKPAQNPQTVTHTASQPLKAAPAPLGRGAYGVKVNFGRFNPVNVDFGGIGQCIENVSNRLKNLLPEQTEGIRASVNTLRGKTGTEQHSNREDALFDLASDIVGLPHNPKHRTIADIEAARHLNEGYPDRARYVLATVRQETNGLSPYGQKLLAEITPQQP